MSMSQMARRESCNEYRPKKYAKWIFDLEAELGFKVDAGINGFAYALCFDDPEYPSAKEAAEYYRAEVAGKT